MVTIYCWPEYVVSGKMLNTNERLKMSFLVFHRLSKIIVVKNSELFYSKSLKYHMILFSLGFQWADFTEDSCRQVCQKGATCISKCKLGYQIDAVVTHHHDWILESRHACCLPGCTADSQKQSMLSVTEWSYFMSNVYTTICAKLGILDSLLPSCLCLWSCPHWLTECC